MNGVLSFPIHQAVTFILVGPHYPENLGAVARAMKTMGFTRLVLVKPGKMANPSHLMARKMAVKSLDVLEGAQSVGTLDEALVGFDIAYATTSRSGVSYIVSARDAAREINGLARTGKRVAVLLGNEKTGLDAAHVDRCKRIIRIAMAAEQPSINLAQTAQILAYELFVEALSTRATGNE
jgi:TrmH family RNA methyltransferase